MKLYESPSQNEDNKYRGGRGEARNEHLRLGNANFHEKFIDGLTLSFSANMSIILNFT